MIRQYRRWSLCILLIAAVAPTAMAAQIPFDNTNFGVTTYQPTSGFSEPNWIFADVVEGSGDNLAAGEVTNSWPTVLYNTNDVLGSRVKFLWSPALPSEDDLSGFVLGFGGAGEEENDNANFLIFDWKRVTQGFDFTDPLVNGQPALGINDSTPSASAPAGLRAGWVTGVPSADELWGHESFVENARGGVTDITRATNLGSTGYTPGQEYIVEIEYTANNVTVSIDGTEEFNFAPSDVVFDDLSSPASFPQGKFGFYEHSQSPGGVYSQLDVRPVGDPSAQDPSTVFTGYTPPSGVKAVAITVPSSVGAGNADALWTITGSTTGDNGVTTATLLVGPNRGDVDFAWFDSSDTRLIIGLANPAPVAADGVMIATVAQNGGQVSDNPSVNDPIFVVAEAPYNSGFNQGRFGIATNNFAGGEANVDVSAAFFLYSDGWSGGSVDPSGNLVGSSSDVSVTRLPQPTSTGQPGLYNVQVTGKNSQSDGLLFVVGASNEDNLAAATPMDDGTWNVGVRDSNSATFGGPETFEADDFNFLYIDFAQTENLIAGAVEADGTLSQQVGDYSITNVDIGQYRLSIDGVVPSDGILLLTSTESIELSNGETAPLNHYLTYEPDGDDFLIEVRQIGSFPPPLTNGAFSFAYVDFDNPLSPARIPEPSSAFLLIGLALAAAAAGGRLR